VVFPLNLPYPEIAGMVQVWVTSLVESPKLTISPGFFLAPRGGTMASGAEQCASRLLRAILADLPNGGDIPDSKRFREALSDLEWFLPEVLAEVYPKWNCESLDGIYPFLARKTGAEEAEIFGQCIFISDQTLTPLHLRLQISPDKDEVSWLECRLGEKGQHGIVRTPYHSLNANFKRLYLLEGRADEIDWVYKVTFGRKRP
jgi:hypothetical protein